MQTAVEPRLLEFFLTFRKLGSLDNPTKAALRLCNKQSRVAIDATIVACTVKTADLDHFLTSNWHLSRLVIDNNTSYRKNPSPESLRSSLAALPGKFPLLEELECNDLPVLPENIGLFSRLQTLRINDEDYEFQAFPSAVSQLTALETLELSNFNNILTRESLAPLKHLKQLKRLEIIRDHQVDDDHILALEWMCTNLTTSLEHLHLTDEYHSLPSSISNLNKLTSLILYNLSEGEAPESIGSLSLLQELVLTCPEGLIALPLSVSKLTALRNLIITTNDEVIAPLQHLTCLEVLDLEIDNMDDELIEFPSFIWNFVLLKTLCLTCIFVHSLPAAISNMRNLESLELKSLTFQELPDSIGKLSSLTNLDLSGCKRLERLPNTIGTLPLKSLSIRNCHALQSLPESLGSLSLINLRLSSNSALTQLPSSIGKLKSLESLIVDDCALTEVPESVGNLPALKELRIENCSLLTSIPETLCELICRKAPGKEGSALETVSIVDCPNLVLSPEVHALEI